MRIDTFVHEDDRRVLIEAIKDMSLRNLKIICIKSGRVGNHFHKLKDDVFFLVSGFGSYTLDTHQNIMKEGDCIVVKAGQYHSFNLKPGSILLEASTLPYDEKDEYSI